MKNYPFANGDTLPALGLGTWKSEKGKVYQAIKDAIKIGYRHFDCAPIYGNEVEIGHAFKEVFDSGAIKREDLWITSKLWNNAHVAEDVLPALHQTLSDLQVDYLDLYLIHWPVVLKPGVTLPKQAADFSSLDEVPLAETWKALAEGLRLGLSRHLGVSNFSQQKLAHLIQAGSVKPEVNQVESHPFLQQMNLLDFCRREQILLTAYSPLGSGDRAASFKKPDEPNLIEHPLIQQIAAQRGISPAQVLIAWGLSRNSIVLAKSVSPVHLQENFEAAEIELNSQELAAIADLEIHYRFVDGSFWTTPGSPYTLSNLWDE
jgi:alcohol dehydrogenase (NADP+)